MRLVISIVLIGTIALLTTIHLRHTTAAQLYRYEQLSRARQRYQHLRSTLLGRYYAERDPHTLYAHAMANGYAPLKLTQIRHLKGCA